MLLDFWVSSLLLKPELLAGQTRVFPKCFDKILVCLNKRNLKKAKSMHSTTQQGSFNTCVCVCGTQLENQGLQRGKKLQQQNYSLNKQQLERYKQRKFGPVDRRVSKAERMSARGRISNDKVSPSHKTCSPPVSKRTRLCGKRRRMASAASASEVAKAAARSFAAGVATENCDKDSVSALMSSSPALTPPASTKTVRRTSLTGIDKYEIQETRGRGNYGVVYKARNREDNKIVAIKKTAVDNNGEGIPGTTLREVSLLKDLKHGNIVS